MRFVTVVSRALFIHGFASFSGFRSVTSHKQQDLLPCGKPLESARTEAKGL